MFEEAERLRLPIVLITDSLETRLARRADVVVPARRGKHERVALHGVTVIVLEAITFVRLSTGPLLSRIAAEGRRPSWTLACSTATPPPPLWIAWVSWLAV